MMNSSLTAVVAFSSFVVARMKAALQLACLHLESACATAKCHLEQRCQNRAFQLRSLVHGFVAVQPVELLVEHWGCYRHWRCSAAQDSLAVRRSLTLDIPCYLEYPAATEVGRPK